MFPVTKKFGCEAQIKIIEIDEFPGFKVRMRKSSTVMIRVKQSTLLPHSITKTLNIKKCEYINIRNFRVLGSSQYT